ncbi:hypothetical protein I3760_15G028800 [Carya illinoinensis]|uniref:Chalcone synthase n=1 Tax=Carya illinoinensis TaxID=32201 RepID=A0A8T1N3X8_CARIL|nr:chalcone synthase-like [Carya illinoinensis]KAG2665867.1 hypothetical protein I3760_15G028800 [Carya illinoinensis]KAG6626179.1 hypothetical protein CIPAW_15G030400 [Carya illinoinensis]KAG6674159.1 hypothetical protein I3842_15G029300 [Carya illinoinensis]
MASVEEMRKAPRARGLATILAIGTANPKNCIHQKDYPDFYFRVTGSEHMTELKDKFKRICDRTTIRKRYCHLTEEILKANSNMCKYKAPSLDARQNMLISEVPKLGTEAALKAIEEWGQPISKITHLVFCSSSSIDMPGADFQLTKLLGLNLSINRYLISHQACYAGGTGLRIAKDLAENNAGARVLVVCSDIMTVLFHAPCETHIDILIGQALFTDGAAAVIIGANPDTSIEHPLFELVSARQSIIPDSESGIRGTVREMGLTNYLSEKVPKSVGDYINNCLVETFSPIGLSDWNSLFYVVHPGGPAILNRIQEKLDLNEEKLRASRHVLSEYGNMTGPCVLLVLDEVRKKSAEEGNATTGEGLEWGVLLGLGPGLTVETLVLHSIPIN